MAVPSSSTYQPHIRPQVLPHLYKTLGRHRCKFESTQLFNATRLRTGFELNSPIHRYQGDKRSNRHVPFFPFLQQQNRPSIYHPTQSSYNSNGNLTSTHVTTSPADPSPPPSPSSPSSSTSSSSNSNHMSDYPSSSGASLSSDSNAISDYSSSSSNHTHTSTSLTSTSSDTDVSSSSTSSGSSSSTSSNPSASASQNPSPSTAAPSSVGDPPQSDRVSSSSSVPSSAPSSMDDPPQTSRVSSSSSLPSATTSRVDDPPQSDRVSSSSGLPSSAPSRVDNTPQSSRVSSSSGLPSTARNDDDREGSGGGSGGEMFGRMGVKGHPGRVATYEVIRMDAHGSFKHIFMSRREVLAAAGCQARELRRIDPNLALSGCSASAPTLRVPRLYMEAGEVQSIQPGGALLVNMGAVRLAVQSDHALLFDVHSKQARRFLSILLARTRIRPTTNVPSPSSSASKKKTKKKKTQPGVHTGTWPSVPSSSSTKDEGGDDEGAEMREMREKEGRRGTVWCVDVVEAALEATAAELEEILLQATPKVTRLLKILPNNISAKNLEDLRLVKQSLVEEESRAGMMRRTLLEVLDDPEDVRGLVMHLTGLKLNPQGPHSALEERAEEEVESMLEYFLQRYEVCQREAERLLENMRDLEESMSVSLSARRLEISKLELVLSIASFAVTLGALVSGILGMNLVSRLEEHAFAFYIATFGIISGIILITVLLYWYVQTKMRQQAQAVMDMNNQPGFRTL